MRKVFVASIGIAWLAAHSVGAAKPLEPGEIGGALQSQPPSAAPQTSPARELVNRYCVACHNEKLKTAGLLLDQADTVHVGNAAETWEKVVLKLRTRAMPPPGNRRPDNATYDAVAAWLETELDRAAAAAPNPGRPTIHRLNRTEYANAIRDLFGLEIDGRSLLPPDEQAYGFDNIADALLVTPGLLDRYLSAAAKITRVAVGDPTIPAGFERYTGLKNLWQDDRRGEEFPFTSRGGLAIRHYFPVDAEYVIKVRVTRTYTELIRGLADPNQIEIRVDGVRVAQFTIGGKRVSRAELEDYQSTADDGLEVRIPVKAGARLVLATIVKTMSSEPEGLGPARVPISTYTYATDTSSEMGIASILIGGPYNGQVPQDSPSRRQIFICQPSGARDEIACATKILSTVARRAYRRPTTNEDLQRLLAFFKTGRAERGFEAGIRSALEMILVNPNFLFRFGRDPVNVGSGAAYRISDLELASRLSFFLWSSIPDDTLLDLATRGKLSDPAVLDQQVRRMLANSRAREALADNFFGQWLQVRNVWGHVPDTSVKFPWFDDNLREAFSKETELFLHSQLQDDRSVINLLTADYTFLNERLARHYGIPKIYGSHFRRVTLADENRWGLLGQGSILSVTSYSNRTSPTLRGKWLLENILAAPTPPPPPNVDTNLKVEGAGIKPTTVREALEQHRKNPVCASCHARMDPLGLSLENFDGVGQWRTTDAGKPIDASGVLLDGTKFTGPAELRKALLDQKEQFVTAVTGKLLTYALGRHVEYYDAPAIRRIVRDTAADDYRWSSLILAIVKSMPFQFRRPKS